MISTTESTSTRKSIDLTVTPSATGLTVSGGVRWFDESFTIPATVIPCTYVEDQAYRVVLCRSVGGPVLVLADEDGIPSGYDEVCSPIRWRFTQASDTCATVAIEVVKRTLVPELDSEGNPIALPPPTSFTVSTTPVLPTVGANKTASRAFRARVRDLRQQLRTLKQAGTTYSAMTAAQRQLVQEYCALTGEPAPLAVP